ncbi:MAG: GNAT family N-acetyltransferase, partial [Lacrimispora sphenoides]
MENTVTGRLIIRKFQPSDWQDMYEYLSDKETVAFEPYDIYSEAQAKKEVIRRSNDESFYAVCLKGTEKLIGNLYLGKEDF